VNPSVARKDGFHSYLFLIVVIMQMMIVDVSLVLKGIFVRVEVFIHKNAAQACFLQVVHLDVVP